MSYPYDDFQPVGGPGYEGYAGYNQQPVPQGSNGLAVAALVLGIFGLMATITIIGAVLGIPVALVGVIVAIIAIVKAKNYPPGQGRRGLAIAGLVLSLLSLVAVVLVAIFTFSVFSETGLIDCFKLQDTVEIERCLDEFIAEQESAVE